MPVLHMLVLGLAIFFFDLMLRGPCFFALRFFSFSFSSVTFLAVCLALYCALMFFNCGVLPSVPGIEKGDACTLDAERLSCKAFRQKDGCLCSC